MGFYKAEKPMLPKELVRPALMIKSTANVHRCPGRIQSPRPEDFINQAEPYPSFHPLYEGLQHALRPNRMFRPIPFHRQGFSWLFSPALAGHCPRSIFIRFGHSSSTFLRPFAPQALPCFFAPMDALTPARPALRRFSSHELRPSIGQVSLVHMARPSMHSVTNHLTRPVIAFTLPAQRDRLPGIISGLDFTLNEQARRNVRPNRVRHPTDCMFASGCSPPRLTATQLPSATRTGHLLGKDFHFTDRACFQAHSSPRSGIYDMILPFLSAFGGS